MSPIDTTIIRRKGEQLEQYVKYLHEFREMQEEQFLSDHHNFGLAEHYLEHAIELTLDIARALVAGLSLPMPDEARELFSRLMEADVIPASFAKEHQAMVGLRNRLVHDYAAVDHARVYQYLQKHLSVFEEFLNHVRRYLKEQQDGE